MLLLNSGLYMLTAFCLMSTSVRTPLAKSAATISGVGLPVYPRVKKLASPGDRVPFQTTLFSICCFAGRDGRDSR